MSEDERLGIVAYTDGSAYQDTGDWGAGIHGYIFRLTEDGGKASRANGFVTTTQGYKLKTDTSDAKPVIVEKYIDGFVSSRSRGTNNVGEMEGILRVISGYRDFAHEYADRIKSITIFTDSEMVRKGIMFWMDNWKRAGWQLSSGNPVANVDRWKQIDAAIRKLEDDGVTFEVNWVKGHNDDFGNVKADYTAALGTNHSIEGIETTSIALYDPATYMKEFDDLHPLLSFKRLYYNSNPEFNTPGHYYLASWAGKEYTHGKRMGDVSYCILRMKEPSVLVEKVIERHTTDPNCDVNTLLYLKMDRLKTVDVQQHLSRYGGIALRRDRRCMNLVFADRKPVALEVTPGELPMRTVDTFNHLDQILDSYQKYCEDGAFPVTSVNYCIQDITNLLYDDAEKKRGKEIIPIKVLKKEHGVGVKSFPVVIQRRDDGVDVSIKRPLMFMEDIPNRNTMKQMEDLSPTISLISWSTAPGVYYYAVVIKTEEAVGIWSNYFANQVFA